MCLELPDLPPDEVVELVAEPEPTGVHLRVTRRRDYSAGGGPSSAAMRWPLRTALSM